MFEYGSISGKFGSDLGPSQILRFPELPMYGAFSMLGLTLRAVSRNVSHINDIVQSWLKPIQA